MKIFHLLTFVFCVIMILNCSAYKKNIRIQGDKNQAILNSITDFSHTSRLYKKHTVFQIEFIDTLYQKELKKIDERNYKWVDGQRIEGIFGINILPNDKNKYIYWLTDSTGIGTKGYLPSKFIELNNKLFYWMDNEYSLTEEMIEVLQKFQLLGDEKDVLELNYIIDDSQKGVDYFICRNDYSKYKKVTTNLAIEYYNIPEVECN